MYPRIVQVVPTKEHTVYVYFEDGKIVCYDVKPLFEKEVFVALKEVDVFMQTCTIMNDTLAWDITGNKDNSKCIDIDPDTLYELDAVNDLDLFCEG